MSNVVGLCGLARSGKDTLSEMLCRLHGYNPYPFALPIKQCINEMYGWNEEHSDGQYKETTLTVETTYGNMAGAIRRVLGKDIYGFSAEHVTDWWIGVLVDNDCFQAGGDKEFRFELSPRKAYQLFGTDLGRDMLAQDIWLDKATEFADKHGKVLITDVRFENEAQWISKMNGSIIRIERQGVDGSAVRAHASEAGISEDYVTMVLPNNGTIEELENVAKILFTGE